MPITKEQEAIEKLEYYLKNSAYKRENSDFFKNGGWEIVDLEIPKAIETVLNMLKEKDKQIDLMANYIVDLIKYNNPEEKREVEEIKQYFENQNKLFKYDYNKKSTLDINSNAEI